MIANPQFPNQNLGEINVSRLTNESRTRDLLFYELTWSPITQPDKDLLAFDNGRLVERILLAAKAHGLGSNVMTVKGEGPQVLKKALGIPEDRRVWTVVAIGHIDREARRKRPANPNAGRKANDAFVHMERY